MSLEGQTTEAVLAAAFGADTDTPAPADAVNLFVDLDTGTPSGPAQDSAPATTESTAAAPADTNNHLDDLRSRLAQAEQQAAYMKGLAEARAAAMAAAQQTAPAPAEPAYDPAEDALSPEEMMAFKESLPVVEKVARQAAMRVQQQVAASMQRLYEENAALRQQMQQVSGMAHNADEQALMHTVRSAVPDAETITKTAAWKQYLDSRAPFSGGRAVREVLDYAVKNRDAETITEHLTAFKASRNITQPPQPVVAPGRTATHGAVGLNVPQPKRGISDSALDAAMAKAQAGKLSKEAYDNMLAQAFSAIASGSELVQ